MSLFDIYITVDNHEKKKLCCRIKVTEKNNQDQIVIVPCYSKYCYGEKQLSNYHTTRHHTFLHRTLYMDKKKVPSGHPLRSYGKQDRPPLDKLSDYEVIGCFQVSPVILDREITKDFKEPSDKEDTKDHDKLEKKKVILPLTAYDNQYYQIYIFVSPLGHCGLYRDLRKYNILYEVFPIKTYEIVVGIESKTGINTTAICDCLNMYNSLHKNKGIGDFKPI